MISPEQVLAVVDEFCTSLNLPVGYTYRLVGEMSEGAVSLYVTDAGDTPLAILLLEEGSARELYRYDVEEGSEMFSSEFSSVLDLFSTLSLYLYPFFSYMGLGSYFSHLLGRSCTTWRDVVAVLGSLAGVDFYPAQAGLSTEGFLLDVYAGKVSCKSFFTYSEPYESTLEMLTLIFVTLSYWFSSQEIDIVYPSGSVDDSVDEEPAEEEPDTEEDGDFGGGFF